MTTYLLTTGDDKITGTSGADTFDETVNGEFGGTDNLSGGGGNDVFMVEMDKASAVDGGSGIDTIVLWGNEIGAAYKNVEILDFRSPSPFFQGSVEQIAEFESIITTGYTGTDMTFRFSGMGGTLYFPGMIADKGVTLDIDASLLKSGLVVRGTSGGNRIEGTAFDDVLQGGAGDDFLSGGQGGEDTFYGFSGDDTFYISEFSSNKGTVFGGNDSDTLWVFQADISQFYIQQVETLKVDMWAAVSFDILSKIDNIVSAFDDYVDISLVGGGGFVDFSKLISDGSRVFVSTARLTSASTVIGTAGNDYFSGSSFADTFEGGAGADTFEGWNGIDTVSYSRAKSGVTAGVGFNDSDDATGDAKGDKLSGIENLVGSAYNDRLYGDDIVNSILGGSGDDLVEGRVGEDRLFGEAGNDILVGGAGADYLSGGTGFDMASYEGASTKLVISLANAAINSGEAAGDTYSSIENLAGSYLADRLYGNNIANSLFGDEADDILTGYDGDDKLFGEDGDDTLIGGEGADYLSGGSGTDTVIYTSNKSGVTANLSDSSGNLGAAAGDTYSSIENLTGTIWDDILTGNAGANTVVGDDGWDTIAGLAGNDRLGGGGGNDRLNGGTGADYLNGGLGNDTATYADAAAGVNASLATPAANAGEAKGDTFNSIENLTGSNFDDSLEGNAGNNLIDGGGGDDTLLGGDGADTLIGGLGADVFDGGKGVDTASYADAAGAAVADLTNKAANTGDAAGDSYGSVENLVGSNFSDQLGGDYGKNEIFGGSGNDILIGHGGDDRLFGGDGNDVLHGDVYPYRNADHLDGGDGIDTASYANAGWVIASLQRPAINQGAAAGDIYISIENLAGSDSRDTLEGNAGGNVIVGNGSNDVLRGMAGDDTLSGGDGYDTLHGGAGADYMSGGVGIDAVSYVLSISGVSASLTAPSSNTGEAAGDIYNSIEDLTGSNLDDRLEGSNGSNRIYGNAGVDTLLGLGGQDRLFGDEGADLLVGGIGNDTLAGGEGEDRLEGGEGEDFLAGDAGDDTLLGDEGDDTLLGGLGADVFNGGEGTDTASYELSTAGISIDLADISTNTGDAAGDVYDSIEILNGSRFADTLRGDDEANDLRGGYGNDTLNGHGGADYLYGYDGFDTASYQDADTAIVASLANESINIGEAAGDIYRSVENLRGSRFDDILNGDDGHNSLLGGEGNDTLNAYNGDNKLFGEAGDDIMLAGTDADYFSGGTGMDTVSYIRATSNVLVVLGASMGGLQATGDTYSSIEAVIGSNFTDGLAGGAGNDKLDGAGGRDIISGGAGNDILIGGGGDDMFIFDSPLDAARNVDFLADYKAGVDTIGLDRLVFTAFTQAGILASSRFASNQDGRARDSSDRIIYETDTGKLFYDADGNGGGAGIHFATIATGVSLASSDFEIG